MCTVTITITISSEIKMIKYYAAIVSINFYPLFYKEIELSKIIIFEFGLSLSVTVVRIVLQFTELTQQSQLSTMHALSDHILLLIPRLRCRVK